MHSSKREPWFLNIFLALWFFFIVKARTDGAKYKKPFHCLLTSSLKRQHIFLSVNFFFNFSQHPSSGGRHISWATKQKHKKWCHKMRKHEEESHWLLNGEKLKIVFLITLGSDSEYFLKRNVNSSVISTEKKTLKPTLPVEQNKCRQSYVRFFCVESMDSSTNDSPFRSLSSKHRSVTYDQTWDRLSPSSLLGFKFTTLFFCCPQRKKKKTRNILRWEKTKCWTERNFLPSAIMHVNLGNVFL